ncbi:uncharacterized LOC101237999 [Hydra vulgaris]|uniref:Bcl-2-like 5 n=1 Tax=Hydra vulgaris TaxID=6087 RepID=A7LM79_HYDVU|nr:uncharacterized LOC101237999 [Hydra vulgaris]ABS84172.1 bcl-2-like 5 [Hydra vulgaris]
MTTNSFSNVLCNLETPCNKNVEPCDKKNIENTLNNEIKLSKTYIDSLLVATYVVKKRIGIQQKYNKIGEKVFELCLELVSKHETFFNNLTNELNISRDNIKEVIKIVLRNVLKDSINFGRITSILAVCMIVSEHCYKNESMSDKVCLIVETTAEIIYENRKWFEANGAWDGLMKYFFNPTDYFWKGFVVTTVGLGAMAGLLYAKS